MSGVSTKVELVWEDANGGPYEARIGEDGEVQIEQEYEVTATTVTVQRDGSILTRHTIRVEP